MQQDQKQNNINIQPSKINIKLDMEEEQRKNKSLFYRNSAKYRNNLLHNSQVWQVQDFDQQSEEIIVKKQTDIIQVINIENQEKTSSKHQKNILILLTSLYEIKDVQILYESNEVKKLKRKNKYKKIQNVYVFIGFVQTYIQQIKKITMKVQIKHWFSTQIKQQTIDLKNSFIIQQKNTIILAQNNQKIINFLLIQGYMILSQIYQKNRQKIQLIKYLYLIARYFKTSSNTINETFNNINISSYELHSSQYFIYFLYYIYREYSYQKLKEFNIIHKLYFSKKASQKIIKQKRYNMFQNGKYYKQFVLNVIFLYYQRTIKQQNTKTILNNLRINLLEQQKAKVYQYATYACKQQEFILLLLNSQIQKKLIQNSQIQLIQYFQMRLQASLVLLSKVKNSEYTQQYYVNSLIQYLTNLQLKANKKSILLILTNENKKKLRNLLVDCKNNLNFQLKYLGLVLMHIKNLYSKQSLIQILSQLLETINPFINNNIYNLLSNQNPQVIIYSLIMKPQQINHKCLLLQYYQKYPLKQIHLNCFVQFLSQKQAQLYCYQTMAQIIQHALNHNKTIDELQQNKQIDKIKILSTIKSSMSLSLKIKQ